VNGGRATVDRAAVSFAFVFVAIATISMTSMVGGALAAPPPNEPAPAKAPEPPSAPPAPSGDSPLSPDLAPEVRQRIIEAAIVEVMRNGLYFSDRIRERLDRDDSLRDYAASAASELKLDRGETQMAIARADSTEGRESLRSLLPERDDAEAIRRLVRRDLLRAAAPLDGETPLGDDATTRAVDAAKRLLVEQMQVPGGTAIWGKVDREVDRKIRLIVASRAPRPERRAWCELAAWTMLVQGLDDRAVGIAEESTKWLSESGRPASADMAVVSILAQKQLTTIGDVRLLAERRRAPIDSDPDLRARLDRALRD